MSRQNELETTSKFLSFLLRHHPEAAGITLDEHGWANVEELLAGVNQTRSLTSEQLELIVDSDAKKRYSFDKTHSRIRANQGHSIPVDVELKPCEPPEVLYHGTGEKFTASIEQSGLLPKSRLYVHLSLDTATARMVGQRHGKPVVYLVLAGEMARNGYSFFRSENGIYLTREVPVSFLKRIDGKSAYNEKNELR